MFCNNVIFLNRLLLPCFVQGSQNNEEGRESAFNCKTTMYVISLVLPVGFDFKSTFSFHGCDTDGFGENGRSACGDEAAVPPNATLQITFELVSWKTVSEITEDKKVAKKILKEGEGYERPNEGAIVKCEFSSTCRNNVCLVHLLLLILTGLFSMAVKLIGKLQDGTLFLIYCSSSFFLFFPFFKFHLLTSFFGKRKLLKGLIEPL